MRISELIQRLAAVQAQYGDGPVEVQEYGDFKGVVEEVLPVNIGSAAAPRWRASLVI